MFQWPGLSAWADMFFHVNVTCDDGGHAPANGVVEPHGSVVDVTLLGLHPVDVKTLHKHPSKRGHEEIMQQDGNDCTQELEGCRKIYLLVFCRKKWRINISPVLDNILSYPILKEIYKVVANKGGGGSLREVWV